MEFKPLQSILYQQFQQCRDRVAIECDDQHVTYGELYEKSKAITRDIRGKQVAPGTFIGIYTGNRINLIASLIGILNARCIFIILDTVLPIGRIGQMLRLTGTRYICGEPEELPFQQQDFVEPGEGLVFISCQNHIPQPVGRENLDGSLATGWQDGLDALDYDSEDPVYIFFTSGSTGIPRAFTGKNGCISHFLEWEIEFLGLDYPVRVSQLTSPGFDAFLRDTLIPLVTGGTLCIPANKEILLDSRGLTGWLDTRQVNLVHCVPSVMRMFNRDDLSSHDLKCLKYILLSGEPLRPREIKQWFNHFGERIRLINLYGTSETTMAKIFHPVRLEDVNLPRIPVGKPLPGAEVYVLDENMELCEDEFPGQVYIRTRYRTLGYYNDPQANQERFIPNPLTGNPEPGDWFHWTGDIGRIMEDGNLDILGRIDRQVKIHGVRLELEEIESILLNFPEVKEAAVITRNDQVDNNDLYLCAYVTGSREIASEELREHVSRYLPTAVIPAFFVQLEKMPLNANGKVDRNKLPDPVLAIGADYTPPRDEMERRLVTIWAEVLGIKKEIIGIDSHFFRLGGHSLKATRMVELIHRDLHLRLPLLQIFKTPFIRALAQFLLQTATQVFSPVEAVEKREYYPLSAAQKRLFILQQVNPGNVAYNMPQVIPLGNLVDGDWLEKGIKRLIERHESLRTSFGVVDEEPVQIVHDQVEFQVERVAYDLVSRGFMKPFNLAKAPLLRAGIASRGGEPTLLLVDMHHIITDGISMGLLINDMTAIIQEKTLPRLTIQYKDFSQWQKRQKHWLKEQETFWLEQFEPGIQALELPTDLPRPAMMEFEGDAIQFQVAATETILLKELALQHNATLYIVMLAIYYILLYKLTGQEDIVVGTPIAGRRHADLEKVIGMFVNTLPMRNFPSGDIRFNDFLDEVTNRTLLAYENQDYQFEDLVEKLGTSVERNTARNPLFDVVFVLQNMGENLTGMNPEPGTDSTPTIRRNAKFDVSFVCMETNGTIGCLVQYRTRLFKEETMNRWAGYYCRLVEQLVQQPNRTADECEMMTEGEREKLLDEFNGTVIHFPQGKTVVDMFNDQVAQTPDHIALIGPALAGENGVGLDWQRRASALTYREFNGQAQRLAVILNEQGAGPGTIVAVLLDRSVELMIGLMGILKSGAAYLPIDPVFPAGRVRYMIEDSRALLLLAGPRFTVEQGVSRFLPAFNMRLVHGVGMMSTNSLKSTVSAGNLAYIIYTSGSTGRPKGVMIDHGGFFNCIYWRKSGYGLTPADAVLQLFSVAFDGFVTSFFTPLVSGSQVVIVPGEGVGDTLQLEKIISRYLITHFICIPSLYAALLAVVHPRSLGSLKVVTLAGEAVYPGVVEKSREWLPDVELVNEYGATENTVVATIGRHMQPGEAITVGKPIANTCIYILGSGLGPVPMGVAGELCIAGPGLARGYLNNPVLTAERFITLKETRIPGRDSLTRLYKSGDRARWLADGSIQLLGRGDSQLKIRGYRIEAGEIENCLQAFPGILQAAVSARRDINNQAILCAYLVCQNPPDPQALNGFLSRLLPVYMLPAYYMLMERLPLSAGGKIDYRRLPDPDITGAQLYVAPRNDLEKQMVEIWSDILGLPVERIGVEHDFFQLGGHSLNATVLAARIHKLFDVQLPLAEFFAKPTVAALCSRIEITGWLKNPGKTQPGNISNEDIEEFTI